MRFPPDFISGAFSELIHTIAILLIALPNAVIGFWQERSAEESIAAL